MEAIALFMQAGVLEKHNWFLQFSSAFVLILKHGLTSRTLGTLNYHLPNFLKSMDFTALISPIQSASPDYVAGMT